MKKAELVAIAFGLGLAFKRNLTKAALVVAINSHVPPEPEVKPDRYERMTDLDIEYAVIGAPNYTRILPTPVNDCIVQVGTGDLTKPYLEFRAPTRREACVKALRHLKLPTQ